jgi:hypothetical protein
MREILSNAKNCKQVLLGLGQSTPVLGYVVRQLGLLRPIELGLAGDEHLIKPTAAPDLIWGFMQGRD